MKNATEDADAWAYTIQQTRKKIEALKAFLKDIAKKMVNILAYFYNKAFMKIL